MNRGNGKQARWMWLDCRPSAASPICLRVCHPISQAAGGNWVHCSHHRIPRIESFIIWITMNVNEPHVCSRIMGKNRSLLATITTHSTSPNACSAHAFFVQSHTKMPTRANMFTATFISLTDTCTYTAWEVVYYMWEQNLASFCLKAILLRVYLWVKEVVSVFRWDKRTVLTADVSGLYSLWVKLSWLHLTELYVTMLWWAANHTFTVSIFAWVDGRHPYTHWSFYHEWQGRAWRTTVRLMCFELFMQNKPRHVFLSNWAEFVDES